MTLNFSLLRPEFAWIAQQLIAALEDQGYDVNPYYGIRTLDQQAKLYRRSRSTDTIRQICNDLRGKGCHYLASVIERVGPQKTGPWATNALPGESYHCFGLAMDCLLTKDGRAGVDADYKVFADTARVLGLKAGYYFSHPDMGHVQLGKENRPFGYTIKQINDYFEVKDSDT